MKNFHKIEFSEHDKRMKIKIPSLTDSLLAYETGVHIGDGSLQMIDGGTHSVRYWGHGEHDWEFMAKILPRIIKQLYNKDVAARKCGDSNKCVLSVCSKAVSTFKKNVIGLPAGKKSQMKELPPFVKRNKNLVTSCLRGVADTDFSLYFQKDGTAVIDCIMSNRNLIRDIAIQLRKLGFDPKLRFDIKRYRKGKENIEHRIRLYGKKNLEKWMKVIGFSNPYYLSKLPNK